MKLLVTQLPISFQKLPNFQGYHFQLTTLVEPPFTSKMNFNSANGKYELEGSFPDLLNTLSETMNFTYTIEPPPDNAWGGLQEDGTWNGIMNLVQNNIKDFGKN